MTLVIQRGVPERRGQAPALRAEHRLSANAEALRGPWCRWDLGQLIQACGHLTSGLGSLGPTDHKGKTRAQGPSQCEESKRRAEERAEAPGKEGTKPTNTLRPRSRTGTAAHRQACPAAQVLPSPLGLCHGKTAAQREASATWNKQGSWPTEDEAKRPLGPPFLCRRRGLVRAKVEKKAQRQWRALRGIISGGREGGAGPLKG